MRSPPPSRLQSGPTPSLRHVPVFGRRERALLEREKLLRIRERSLAAKERSIQAREALGQTVVDVERLIEQLRLANEGLVVAAVRAQYASDEASRDAAQARTELEHAVKQVNAANARIVETSTQTRTLETVARQREHDYQQLSNRLLQLQNEERRRLASDLHDSTAQRLAALTMNLDLMDGSDLGSTDSEFRRLVSESRRLSASCAQEVRTLAYLLYPPLLEERGLASAVRWYVEGFMQRSGVRVRMELVEIGRLPQPLEAALFRVVQESLTNVHRHASTSTASIQLTTAASVVVLEVRDSGRGLRDDLNKRMDSPPGMLGVGVQGMREHIRQLGGTFAVAFTGKGTTVRVTVPGQAYDSHPDSDR